MIENEQQYLVTRMWIDRFREFIQVHDTQPPRHRDPRMQRVIRDSLVGQLATLEQQAADYEVGVRPPPPPICLPAVMPMHGQPSQDGTDTTPRALPAESPARTQKRRA